MAIRPVKKSTSIELVFEVFVDREFIEESIEQEGVRPSAEWRVSFSLDEVPQPLRSRLRAAHRQYMEVDPFPTLPRPTDDPEEFLAMVEPWLDRVLVREGEEERAELDQQRAEEEEQARFRTEMQRWAMAHGSQRLKLAIERSYKATTTYANERAQEEMPGFWVDTASDADWGERSDPSEEALMLEKSVANHIAGRDLGVEPRIVWLVEPPRALERWLEEDGEGFEAQEAVVVPDFLGRYTLILPVDEEIRNVPEESS